MAAGAAIRGSRPGRMPPRSQISRPGRTCAAPGCTTQLSIYNQGSHCWQHTELRFPNYRGKRLARSA